MAVMRICGTISCRPNPWAPAQSRSPPVTLLPSGDVRTDSPVIMHAVSAREEASSAHVRRQAGKPRGPLHWLLLIAPSAGTADLAMATTVPGWSALRWRIERFFHALEQGTRIEDRHLDSADDFRTCFALDAITALRDDVGVWDLTHLARTRAPPAAARAMTIERFVVLTGGLAGFHPAKRQPLPGIETLWQGVRTLFECVLAIRTWENSKVQMTDAASSVLH